jgi:uncharacterized membrane protein YcjF (UPF0283 family)
MFDNFKIAFSGAVAAIIYQAIRYGLNDIDWLAPIVVGVVTLVVFSVLSSIRFSNKRLIKNKL